MNVVSPLQERVGSSRISLPVISLGAEQEPVKDEKEPRALERRINLIIMSAGGYGSDVTKAYKKALPLVLELYLGDPSEDNRQRAQGIALLAGGKENHDLYLAFVGKKATPAIVERALLRARTEAEAVVEEESRITKTFVVRAAKEEPKSFKYTLALAGLVSSGQPVPRLNLIHAISELNLAGPQYNQVTNSLTDFITRDSNVNLATSDMQPVLEAIEKFG